MTILSRWRKSRHPVKVPLVPVSPVNAALTAYATKCGITGFVAGHIPAGTGEWLANEANRQTVTGAIPVTIGGAVLNASNQLRWVYVDAAGAPQGNGVTGWWAGRLCDGPFGPGGALIESPLAFTVAQWTTASRTS